MPGVVVTVHRAVVPVPGVVAPARTGVVARTGAVVALVLALAGVVLAVLVLTVLAGLAFVLAVVVSGLGLAGFDLGQNPVALALEWGVRRLGEELELRTKAGLVKPVIADLFPAYDADGGLLVALSPRSG